MVARALEERHRVHGPPTLRYFARGLRGSAAQYQDRAGALTFMSDVLDALLKRTGA